MDNVHVKDECLHTPVVQSRLIESKIHIAEQKAEHEIELEEIEHKTQLKTCCNTSTDQRLLNWVGIFIISIFTLTFSSVRLVYAEDCNETNTYIGLISLILGWWFKSSVSK